MNLYVVPFSLTLEMEENNADGFRVYNRTFEEAFSTIAQDPDHAVYKTRSYLRLGQEIFMTDIQSGERLKMELAAGRRRFNIGEPELIFKDIDLP